jgi:hypothetical protein
MLTEVWRKSVRIFHHFDKVFIDIIPPFPTMTPDVTAEAGLYSGAGDPISWGADPVSRDG